MRNVITILILVLMLAVTSCGGSPFEPTAASAPTEASSGLSEDQGEADRVENDREPEPAPSGDSSQATQDFAAFTDAQTEFLDETSDIANGYAVWFDKLNDQIDLVIADAALFGDETWKADSEEILESISRLNQEVRGLESPEGCEEIHGHFLEAAEHYESFVSLYTEGIDALDVDKIDRAINEMVAGSKVIGKASESIDEFVE